MGVCRGLVLSAVGIVKRTRTLVPSLCLNFVFFDYISSSLPLGASPQVVPDARKSTNRNVRLYHCIANYIDRNSSIYRDAQTLFPDDGRALFNYIWHKGERAFTARQQIRREAKWKDASISALIVSHGRPTY